MLAHVHTCTRAHRYIDELGDPYKTQMEAQVKFVMQRMRQLGYTNDHSLAYQSKVGPVEWLKPYTDDTIRELASEGVRSLVVVPISFVSEHIETLEEIDCEYQELAEEVRLTSWQRLACMRAGICARTRERMHARIHARRWGSPRGSVCRRLASMSPS